MSNTLNTITTIAGILAQQEGKAAPICKGLCDALENPDETLKKPETWEQYKMTVTAIMGFFPAALPYVALVAFVFDIIIAMLRAESD